MTMQAVAPVLAATAAVTAATIAYLDAKLTITPDISLFLKRRRAFKLYTKATKENRISPYYVFEATVQKRGNAEAIWSRRECLTFNQVYKRVNQYAQWFLSQGVNPGDLVAFFMINSADFMCAWLGLCAIGAATAMINTNLVSRALLHCISISKAKLILADGSPEMMNQLAGINSHLKAAGCVVFQLDEIREHIYQLESKRPGDELRRFVTGDGPGGLFYTSGTTDLPKACTIPVWICYMSGVSKAARAHVVKGGDERGYNCMPLYHLTGGLQAWMLLMNGETLCLAPKFSASTFWEDIRDSRATWFVYVGETLRYLLATPPNIRDKEHAVHTVWGNGLRADVWTKFRDRFGIEKIHEFYNSTELVLSFSNPCRGDFLANCLGQHGFLQRRMFHNAYIPVAVDTETGDILRDPKTGFATRMPYQEGGEILVALNEVKTFKGYHDNADATAKKFATDVFKKGDRFYRSGDFLRRDDEGRWFFCDRLGDTFRWKGENVSTTEVSEVLGRFPGVLEATVYGVELPGHDGRAGVAALLLEPGLREKFDYGPFLNHCQAHLPRYAVPTFLRHIDESYTTGNQKQNKVPLKQDGVDPKKANGDKLYWIHGNGKGATYVPFTDEDWHKLTLGKAKL